MRRWLAWLELWVFGTALAEAIYIMVAQVIYKLIAAARSKRD